MELKTLLSDDRGVSPVIGVILMVAITVILAAVIGTFVLGLGSNVGNNAPSATFNYDYGGTFGSGTSNTAYINVTDQGGQQIQASNLNISVPLTNGSTNVGVSSSGGLGVSITQSWSGKISAGDTLKLKNSNPSTSIAKGKKVQIIWQSGSGGSSSIISTSTTPSS